VTYRIAGRALEQWRCRRGVRPGVSAAAVEHGEFGFCFAIVRDDEINAFDEGVSGLVPGERGKAGDGLWSHRLLRGGGH